MKILIVDDNKYKINVIKDLVLEEDESINIDISLDIISAKRNLQLSRYDMLILDLNIPIFEGEDCSEDAGINLLKEINRTQFYKKPREIIVVTAHEDLRNEYEKEIKECLFNAIKYDISEEEWKNQLTKKIKHIQSSIESTDINKIKNLKSEKILFISHSSKDKEYVQELVSLIEFIGLKSKEKLFCSSIPGYDIPIEENIYDYLKNQLNKEIYVIFLLSENYYNSTACLNEMGAAWIKSAKYISILIPGFKYTQIEGAIDDLKIGFDLLDKNRFGSFKDSLINYFGMEEIERTRWNDKIDKSIIQFKSIYDKNKKNNKNEKINLEQLIVCDNETVECAIRFINNNNVSMQCKDIKLVLEDNNSQKIEIIVTSNDLDKYKFHRLENRIEKIKVQKGSIDYIERFNLYNWKVIDKVDNWIECF